MSSKDAETKFGMGLILGLAVGAAIAFLFAPKSGKETREMVKDKAAGVSESVRNLTADRSRIYSETWKKHKGQHRVSETYFD